jgi:hypothetical protein
MRPSGLVGQTFLAVIMVTFDPLVGCLSRDAVSLGQLRYGVIVQLMIAEEVLSLFAHGNTFPRHG